MAEEPEKVSSSAALQQPPSSSSGEVAVFKPQVCLNPGPYDEQTNRGAGIYAVSVHHHQFGAPLPSNYLIPLTYNIPTARPSNESEAGGDSRSPFSLIYSLYLKLAAVIFLFNQDGSRQRRAVLVIFATIIYLYVYRIWFLSEEAAPGVEGQENVDAVVEQGNQWWGIVKEIQMVVFVFITSLLPGFHNID